MDMPKIHLGKAFFINFFINYNVDIHEFFEYLIILMSKANYSDRYGFFYDTHKKECNHAKHGRLAVN